jgi:hypothetical protein
MRGWVGYRAPVKETAMGELRTAPAATGRRLARRVE